MLLKEYIADGYLPEAMANFLANVGWNLDGSTEVFTSEQAIAAFDIAAINPSPAAFPYDKLVWLNGVYIRQLDDDDLYRRLLPFVAAGMGMSEAALAARSELRPAVPLDQGAHQDAGRGRAHAGLLLRRWRRWTTPTRRRWWARR